MIVPGSGPLPVFINITLLLMVLGLLLAFVRLARGPSLPDRVVALDLIGVTVVGFIAVYSIVTDQPAFIDVAIVVALISFLGTTAFSRYLERRGAP